jgi:hypothetical protein
MARYRRFDEARAGSLAVPPAQLEGVRSRRAGLRAAMGELEHALAAAAPNRPVEWTVGVRDALHDLHEVWTRHVVETEAPGAFFDELVTESPRLATPAARLRREHSEIGAAIVRAERLLATAAVDDAFAAWVDGARQELTTLLAALARHRQRGADLVSEAYHVDIGGSS